ncbi:MAG: DNA internalization-related competence protein ComEC/Rec2 [Aquimonas sp.]|nr:DNA internalization-related competence protein ComEC/Rec2 [Aquimonas sp.]
MAEARAPALPPFGIQTALAALAGTSLALLLPRLPATPLIWAVLAAGLALWAWPRSFSRLAGAGLAGAGWSLLWAGLLLEARLPEAMAGRDFTVSGRVQGLPQSSPDAVRFDFVVEQGEGEAALLQGQRLRLGWYRSPQRPEAGSRWTLQVRLKPPRGVVNPGGFDFERHALLRRIAATGYVREGPVNAELEPAHGIDAVRAALSQRIVEALGGEGPGHAGSRFVRALAVADTRGFGERDWEVLRATGTSHLMAISGLHVGLVAGFAALLMRLLYRLWPRLGLRLPLPQGAAAAALLAACVYAALAGFGLPTVRSLLMIAAALLAVLLRRAQGPWQAYALALLLMLALDPLAVLGAGFWLSFLGVAWLLWCLPADLQSMPGWRRLVGAQLVASLGLLPLTVLFFGQASVVGAGLNLLAVPWVSLLVVPLSLIGTALLAIGLELPAQWVLWLAAIVMDLLWWLLQASAGWPRAQVFLPAPSTLALLLAALGLAWVLLPRGVPGRPLALLLLLPLLLPPGREPPAGVLDVWVLDVGQGQAVLLRTTRHALLYDAGPAFGSGLDMGEAAVVPAMRALGLPGLDRLLVSHGDADHAGGTASVLRAYPAELLSSDLSLPGARSCESGEAWDWDGVGFELLHPPEHFPYLGNESSCVLRVEAGGRVLLLPGDIGRLIEQRLVREQGERVLADVLLLPHHGSHSSSSAEFVAGVAPAIGLISAGHRNRFGHPRAEVVERWLEAGTALHSTAEGGALHLRIGPDGVHGPSARRQSHPRLWQAQATP